MRNFNSLSVPQRETLSRFQRQFEKLIARKLFVNYVTKCVEKSSSNDFCKLIELMTTFTHLTRPTFSL